MEYQFDTVYNEFKDLVYNLSLHYMQNITDAEDITQEVFVKVYRNINNYDPQLSSIKTWVYRITINHCLDFLKSRKSKKRNSLLSFFSQNKDDASEPVDFDHPGIAAEDKESMQHLFSLINKLPENQKTAVILVKIEDRTQKEVAEIMGTTVKAVESLLARAKQSLQKQLDKAKD